MFYPVILKATSEEQTSVLTFSSHVSQISPEDLVNRELIWNVESIVYYVEEASYFNFLELLWECSNVTIPTKEVTSMLIFMLMLYETYNGGAYGEKYRRDFKKEVLTTTMPLKSAVLVGQELTAKYITNLSGESDFFDELNKFLSVPGNNEKLIYLTNLVIVGSAVNSEMQVVIQFIKNNIKHNV